MERSRSILEVFEGNDIFALKREMNDFTKSCSKLNSYIVIDLQEIKIIGPKYIIVIWYHVETVRQ